MIGYNFEVQASTFAEAMRLIEEECDRFYQDSCQYEVVTMFGYPDGYMDSLDEPKIPNGIVVVQVETRVYALPRIGGRK